MPLAYPVVQRMKMTGNKERERVKLKKKNENEDLQYLFKKLEVFTNLSSSPFKEYHKLSKGKHLN